MNDICLWKIYSSRAIEEYQQNILEAEGDIGIVQIIARSARKTNAIFFKIRVYEALFWIVYKQTIQQLGVDDEQAEETFQSGQYIQPDRRLLYKLCEELEKKDQAHIVKFMKFRFGSVPSLVMIESVFLHLMSMINGESLCTFVVECLGSLGRADLINTFKHEKCGRSNCRIHRKQDFVEEKIDEQGPSSLIPLILMPQVWMTAWALTEAETSLRKHLLLLALSVSSTIILTTRSWQKRWKKLVYKQITRNTSGLPSVYCHMVEESMALMRFLQLYSFFIHHLCAALHGHEKSLADIMTIVNKKVGNTIIGFC